MVMPNQAAAEGAGAEGGRRPSVVPAPSAANPELSVDVDLRTCRNAYARAFVERPGHGVTMKTQLTSVARITAVVAVAFCASPTKGGAAEGSAARAPFKRGVFTIRPLPFPTTATFKHWTSKTGTTQVCTTRCGGNGGSLSPYVNTPLYGSRYISLPINSSATFVFKEVKKRVAFIWGSPDKGCNFADFHDGTGSLIGEIDASQIPRAGYYSFRSLTPIGSIVFSEGNCNQDRFFEIAQGPFHFKSGEIRP